MLAGAYYFPTDYGIDIAELARALFEVPDVSRDEILRVLDKNASLIAEIA